jgi:diguanylate cyclase (GGDEF)-like protein
MSNASRFTMAGISAAVTGVAASAQRRARPAKADTPLDIDSYRLLVSSLFTSPTSIVVSNIVGAVVPFFCWFATGQLIFLCFTVAATLTIALRFITVRRYIATDHAADTFADVQRWDREYFIGATTFSTILGLNCLTALAFTDSAPAHMITVVSAIAFSSGYVARNAGRPNFVVLQLMCFCLPMALGLFVSGQPYFSGIGVFIVLYVVTNIAIVFSINRNLLALAAANNRSRTLAETLRRQNLTLDSALNSMTHGLMMFDAQARLEVSNSRFAELYGVDPEVIMPGASLRDIMAALVAQRTLSPDSANELVALGEHSLRVGQAGRTELTTGRQQAFVVSFEPTQDGGILMTTEDATARKATAAQIERMARYDGLTGLANRFTFGRALAEACASVDGGGQAAVLYIDLDNFKNINDSLGHESGDLLLIQTADRLRRIAGPRDLVGRFGGDEFVWLHFSDAGQSATDKGQYVVDAMAKPFEVGGSTIYATTSVGIALVGDHGTNPTDVLRAADIALYAAKAAGKNTLALFEPGMEDELRQRREIENDLREACQKQTLFLHYQPIVELGSGRVICCEALMRWEHPTKGMISPAVFIPVAEQTGLIAQMGDWAIYQACMDAVNWPDHVSVAVNVSAFQFKDPARLIQAVKDALKASGLAANRLELEVTESLLIENQQVTLESIRALRRLGVRFSLDDFGVGYSSLAYLAHYPFSKVKIDRTFAKDITTNGPSRSIIETVCRLARDLGLSVVVEGIETEQQQTEAEKLGIELAQGYLFGKPARAEVQVSRMTKAA